MRWSSTMLLAFSLAATGCATTRPPPPIDGGRPAFGPGASEAYWIWRDAHGWHLRTTSAGTPHRFHGAIVPLDGEIADVRPTRLERDDRIKMGQHEIRFAFVTQGGADGFDWHVTSGCTRFKIFIDGAARPDLVHLGGFANRPQHVPFARCP